MSKHLYKEGDQVMHRHNLELKMCVSDIKRKIIKLKDGTQLNKMIGIEVQWFEGNILRKEKFHSNMLLPYEVAMQGEEVIETFINNNIVGL